MEDRGEQLNVVVAGSELVLAVVVGAYFVLFAELVGFEE